MKTWGQGLEVQVGEVVLSLPEMAPDQGFQAEFEQQERRR
jgi:hypothetical protein